MCYNKRGKVGHRTRGSTRIPQTKPEQPTRPSAEDIERLKIERLSGLEKRIVRTLVELRRRRLAITERIKEIGAMPNIQRLATKRQERELLEENIEITARIRAIQSTPRDETGTHKIKQWLKEIKAA